MLEKRLSITQALLWILASMVFGTGGTWALHRHHLAKQATRAIQRDSPLLWIAQTGAQCEGLQTTYLAQLLDLSCDRPTRCGAFDLDKARVQLLNSPLITDAQLRLLNPHTLQITYQVRRPIAWVYDFENRAMDASGAIFPVSPFLSPKQLPEIYLGVHSMEQVAVQTKRVELALALLALAPKLRTVRRIDVANAFESSLGRQQIVLVLDDAILRLSPRTYAQQLGNYLKLREHLKPSRTVRVIDLRVDDLAFLR